MKTENVKLKKMIEKLGELYNLSEQEELLYGDSFIEFTERSIKVLDHSDRIIKNLDKEVIQTSRKQPKGKLYGKKVK